MASLVATGPVPRDEGLDVHLVPKSLGDLYPIGDVAIGGKGDQVLESHIACKENFLIGQIDKRIAEGVGGPRVYKLDTPASRDERSWYRRR